MSGTIPPFSKPWQDHGDQPSKHLLVDGQLRSDADPLPPVDNRFPSTNSDHQPVLDRMIIQFFVVDNPQPGVVHNPRWIVVIKRFKWWWLDTAGRYFFHQSTGVKDKMLKWIPAEMIQGVSSSWCPPRKDGFWNCHDLFCCGITTKNAPAAAWSNWKPYHSETAALWESHKNPEVIPNYVHGVHGVHGIWLLYNRGHFLQ